MTTITLTQGDTLHVFRSTLSWADGTPVTLAGAVIKFLLKSFDGSPAISRTATNPSGSDVEYQPTAMDMALTGQFWQSWQVTFPGGAIQNFPNDEHNVISIIGKLA